MKILYDTLDYSFKIYKKFFLQFTLLSLGVSLPIFIIKYLFVENFEKIVNLSPYWSTLIISLYLIILPIFFAVCMPLLGVYFTLKSYAAYTNSAGEGFFNLNITFKKMMGMLPRTLFYMIIMAVLIIFSFITVIPGLYLFIYYMIGYDKFLMFFPDFQMPYAIDYWSGLINFFISVAGFLWLGYIITRWMLGMQTMYIENRKALPAIYRSYYLSKKSVYYMSLVLLLAFLFVAWSSTLVLFLYSIFSVYMWGSVDLQSNLVIDIISIVSAVTNPFIIIIMTMTYIQLKIKKEALGLEFKLLKMIGKIESINIDNIYMKAEVFDIKDTHLEKAGVMSRFVAYTIDFGIGVFLALFTFALSLFIVDRYNIDFFRYIFRLIFSNLGIFNIDNKFYLAWFLLAIFVVGILLFNIITEILMKGQSIGKKIVGIRVVDHKGDLPSASEIILRNLFRVVDFFPSFFLGGLLVMIFNKREKRLGDIIAKTIVIKDNYKLSDESIPKKNMWGSNLPHAKNIYPVSNSEIDILKEFISYEELSFERKAFFAYNLNVYFSNKFQTKEKYKNPYDFFRDIISMND